MYCKLVLRLTTVCSAFSSSSFSLEIISLPNIGENCSGWHSLILFLSHTFAPFNSNKTKDLVNICTLVIAAQTNREERPLCSLEQILNVQDKFFSHCVLFVDLPYRILGDGACTLVQLCICGCNTANLCSCGCWYGTIVFCMASLCVCVCVVCACAYYWCLQECVLCCLCCVCVCILVRACKRLCVVFVCCVLCVCTLVRACKRRSAAGRWHLGMFLAPLTSTSLWPLILPD